jgi:hypothetical protein
VTEPGRRVGLTSQELTALQTTLFQLTVIVETFPCRALQLWRSREISQPGQSPTDILDVFMDTEDFLDYKHDRKGMALGWAGVIRRYASIACWNLDFTKS